MELADTPFFPQEELQCGPAALATVLVAAGAESAPDVLAPEVFTPGLEGSLQPELLGAVRRRGFLPYVLPGGLDDLLAELVAGRPVLVLQNLGLATRPVWHYAVIIGADPGANTLLLRSGADRRLEMRAGRFLATWERADRWGFVVLKPGELPARVEAAAYARAVVGLEAAGRLPEAERAWAAGLAAEPDEPVYLFGLGNARYGLGDLRGARAAWERYAEARPDDPAGLNNLAFVLGRLGCRERGLSLADRAISVLPEGDPAGAELGRTRSSLQALPDGGDPPGCAAPVGPGAGFP